MEHKDEVIAVDADEGTLEEVSPELLPDFAMLVQVEYLARSGQPISAKRSSRISRMTSSGIGLASVKRIVPLDRS
jgi:hypothetical protein